MATARRSEVLITTAELADRAAPDEALVIDCRFSLSDPDAGYAGYREGHIPGAAYAHLDNDLSSPIGEDTGRHPLPTPDALARTLRRLGVQSGCPVVVYDDAGGAIAARAWWLLRWAGHRHVRILDGGLAAWRNCGLPLESGQAVGRSGDIDVTPDEARVLTTAELAAHAGSIEEFRLVDARDSSRFRGDAEPIDPVAGHIPGSLNLPIRLIQSTTSRSWNMRSNNSY